MHHPYSPFFVTFHHPSLQRQRTSLKTSYCSRSRLLLLRLLQTHTARLSGRRGTVWFYAPRWSTWRRRGCLKAPGFVEASGLFNGFVQGVGVAQGHEHLVIVCLLCSEKVKIHNGTYYSGFLSMNSLFFRT